MGKKYVTKYDPNLGPGTYQADQAMMKTMTKSKSAFIKPPTLKSFKAPEFTPDADDKHLKAFGSELKGIDMGKKYIFKPDTNPAPGQYETYKTKKSYAATIR